MDVNDSIGPQQDHVADRTLPVPVTAWSSCSNQRSSPRYLDGYHTHLLASYGQRTTGRAEIASSTRRSRDQSIRSKL
jgi:hypothetical protein